MQAVDPSLTARPNNAALPHPPASQASRRRCVRLAATLLTLGYAPTSSASRRRPRRHLLLHAFPRFLPLSEWNQHRRKARSSDLALVFWPWCNVVKTWNIPQSLKTGKRRTPSRSGIPCIYQLSADLDETLEEVPQQNKVSLAWVVRDAAERYVADGAEDGRGGRLPHDSAQRAHIGSIDETYKEHR